MWQGWEDVFKAHDQHQHHHHHPQQQPIQWRSARSVNEVNGTGQCRHDGMLTAQLSRRTSAGVAFHDRSTIFVSVSLDDLQRPPHHWPIWWWLGGTTSIGSLAGQRGQAGDSADVATLALIRNRLSFDQRPSRSWSRCTSCLSRRSLTAAFRDGSIRVWDKRVQWLCIPTITLKADNCSASS